MLSVYQKINETKTNIRIRSQDVKITKKKNSIKSLLSHSRLAISFRISPGLYHFEKHQLNGLTSTKIFIMESNKECITI